MKKIIARAAVVLVPATAFADSDATAAGQISVVSGDGPGADA